MARTRSRATPSASPGAPDAGRAQRDSAHGVSTLLRKLKTRVGRLLYRTRATRVNVSFSFVQTIIELPKIHPRRACPAFQQRWDLTKWIPQE